MEKDHALGCAYIDFQFIMLPVSGHFDEETRMKEWRKCIVKSIKCYNSCFSTKFYFTIKRIFHKFGSEIIRIVVFYLLFKSIQFSVFFKISRILFQIDGLMKNRPFCLVLVF